MKERLLILCDFDGTLTYTNSFSYLVFKKFGFIKWSLGMIWLIPTFISFKLKLSENKKTMATVLYRFLSGYSKAELDDLFSDSGKVLESIIRKNMLDILLYLKNELNAEVVIVSASSDIWLKNWCKLYGFELVSSKLKFDRYDRVLKEFDGTYCWGIEKVQKVSEIRNLSNYFIIGFGDTRGDKEMLEISDLSYYKPSSITISHLKKDLN